MAYTSSPQFNTYKSETVRVDGTDFFRSADMTVNRDLQIVNMYYDRVSAENKVQQQRLVKRPGTAVTAYNLTKTASSAVLRGSFYNASTNLFYWAVGNKVYSVAPDVGTSVRTVQTLATSSGYVGFCTFFQDSTSKQFICFTTGTELFVDEPAATTCTKVTDGDLPTHQPYLVYLDGYLFVLKTGTDQIWNSDVDDPLSWTANSFINAEIHSDDALCHFKVKNYLVVLGYNSIEYFWDAGNAAPSSPLSRNDSPVQAIGYITGSCQIGEIVYFVGQDLKKNLAVYAINGFKVDRVSNSVVDRTLQSFATSDNAKGKVTLATDGYSISVDGHTFYMLVTPQTTWAYDIDEKFWYEWKSSAGTGLALEASFTMYNGACYVVLANATYISRMSTQLYQDAGVNFTCRYVTQNLSFDTFNEKVLHRLAVNASGHAATGTSNLSIYYSTDDWATSTIKGPRLVNLFSNSPFTSRLGKFRGISFRLEYTDNYPLFLDGLQLDINVMGA